MRKAIILASAGLVLTFSAWLFASVMNRSAENDVPVVAGSADLSEEVPSVEEITTDAVPESEIPSEQSVLDDIVTKYIALMREGDFSGDLSFFQIGSVGMTPYMSSPYIPLEEAEQKGLLLIPVEVEWERILTNQRKFVTECFGEDAWDNVNYTFGEDMGIDYMGHWIEIKTGKILTEEEIGLEVNSGRISAEEADILYTRTYIPENSLIHARFTFHGSDTAKSGEYDFRITLSDRSGEWQLRDGLAYTNPEPEDMSDV